MKKVFILIEILLLSICLSACQNKDNSSNQETEIGIPKGIWVIRYLGNEDGEYVEEFNLYDDFYGKPVNFIEFAAINYGESQYFIFDEEGKGTFTNFSRGIQDVTIDKEKITYSDGTVKPYTLKNGKLIFEEEPGFFSVMENVSEDTLNKILSGAVDCVDYDKAEIGDLIAIGTYDTVPGNDKTEPLKWRVIDKQDGKLYILCNELIDSFSYNYNPDKTNLDAVTWQNSSLRSFLNDPEGFMTIFTDEEKALIETTHLENKAANEELKRYWGNFHDEGNASYSDLSKQERSDEPDTEDKIFLLSFQEVEKYFGIAEEPSDEEDYPFSEMPRNEKWVAYVTKTVDDNHQGYYDHETLGGAWMTRTLSTAHKENGMMVTYISGGGQVFNYFTYTPMFIRPAMWIKTK